MLIPVASIAVFVLGYYIGKAFRFYQLFYQKFLDYYEEMERYYSMYHPECYDENGDLVEPEEYLYINNIEEEE